MIITVIRNITPHAPAFSIMQSRKGPLPPILPEPNKQLPFPDRYLIKLEKLPLYRLMFFFLNSV